MSACVFLNVPCCCDCELLCGDMCCLMCLFVLVLLLNVFMWFVRDSLCDVVWYAFLCLCCFVCLCAVLAVLFNVFECVVCGLLCC